MGGGGRAGARAAAQELPAELQSADAARGEIEADTDMGATVSSQRRFDSAVCVFLFVCVLLIIIL